MSPGANVNSAKMGTQITFESTAANQGDDILKRALARGSGAHASC